MQNKIIARVVATLVVLIVPLGFFFYFGVLRKPHPVKPLRVISQVRYFHMADQQGDSLSSDDLKGYIYVADFFFTNCATICPRMSGKMAELQGDKFYKNEKKVKLVSFSVDPANDSVPILKNYSEHYHAINGKWYFLSGDKKNLVKMMNKDFELGVTYDSTKADNITHSPYWVLVDGDGKYRGFYKPLDETTGDKEFERLVNDIENLLTEKPTELIHAQPN